MRGAVPVGERSEIERDADAWAAGSSPAGGDSTNTAPKTNSPEMSTGTLTNRRPGAATAGPPETPSKTIPEAVRRTFEKHKKAGNTKAVEELLGQWKTMGSMQKELGWAEGEYSQLLQEMLDWLSSRQSEDSARAAFSDEPAERSLPPAPSLSPPAARGRDATAPSAPDLPEDRSLK